MKNASDKPQRSWLLGSFGKIDNEDWARKLAREGGIGAFLLTASETVGAVMTYYGFSPTTWTPVARMDVSSLDFIISVGISSIAILVLLLMSWRTYVGKGLVSPALLAVLLLYEAYNKILGGTLHAGWGLVYVMVLIGFIGALRAAWYLRTTRKTQKPAAHF